MSINALGFIFANRTAFFSDKFFPSVKAANEELLRWEVLKDGLRNYETSPRDSKEFLEEKIWIEQDDEDWPFSFLRLCRRFHINAKSLQNCLLNV